MTATPTASPEVVHLDPEHPGFGDRVYRARRDAIASVAASYVPGGPIPSVEYTLKEHEVWREVRTRLDPLHSRMVAAPVRDLLRTLPLSRDRIPQLCEVSQALGARTGFRMAPVPGLVAPGVFLQRLADGEFLSTQYVRHASRPHYTPEPDIVHELVGHAATLHDPQLAELNRSFGRASRRADPHAARRIERVYWFTLEFGVCEEKGAPRAVGAGLLSSAGELARLPSARLRAWDLDTIADTAYDTAGYQPCLFVAPSYARMISYLAAWLDAI
jgi:phenylalanine-4-hydroxylase